MACSVVWLRVCWFAGVCLLMWLFVGWLFDWLRVCLFVGLVDNGLIVCVCLCLLCVWSCVGWLVDGVFAGLRACLSARLCWLFDCLSTGWRFACLLPCVLSCVCA